MERQKSIIVLQQKQEKPYGEIADGLRNTGDIVKSSIRRNVKKLETGKSRIAGDNKVREEKRLEKGGEFRVNTHPVTDVLFTAEMLESELDYYMAQKLLKKLREADLISEDELDKITAKNRQSFSPYLARIMP